MEFRRRINTVYCRYCTLGQNGPKSQQLSAKAISNRQVACPRVTMTTNLCMACQYTDMEGRSNFTKSPSFSAVPITHSPNLFSRWAVWLKQAQKSADPIVDLHPISLAAPPITSSQLQSAEPFSQWRQAHHRRSSNPPIPMFLELRKKGPLRNAEENGTQRTLKRSTITFFHTHAWCHAISMAVLYAQYSPATPSRLTCRHAVLPHIMAFPPICISS